VKVPPRNFRTRFVWSAFDAATNAESFNGEGDEFGFDKFDVMSFCARAQDLWFRGNSIDYVRIPTGVNPSANRSERADPAGHRGWLGVQFQKQSSQSTLRNEYSSIIYDILYNFKSMSTKEP
jgi:hypothetical protein